MPAAAIQALRGHSIPVQRQSSHHTHCVSAAELICPTGAWEVSAV